MRRKDTMKSSHMPRFRYQAVDAAGRPVSGSVAAPDEQQAFRDAQARGLKAVRIVAAPSEIAWHERLAREYLSFIFHPVSTKALAVWYRSLQFLLGAGMNVVEAAHSLSGKGANATLRAVSREIAEQAVEGKPLASALANHPSAFPDFARAVMEAGQETGMLQQSAQRMADYYDQLYELQQAYRIETFYPKLLLVAYLAIPILPTLVLGGVGAYLHALVERTWHLAVVLVCAWLGWRLLTQFPWFRRGFDRFKLSLPWFGGIAKRTALARWARSLSALLNAGVPLSRSIEAASAACSNAAIQHAVMAKASGTLQGRPISEVMAESREFPDQMTDMVAMGERSGETAQMLERAAAYYEIEAQSASKQSAIGVGLAFYLAIALVIAIYVVQFWGGYFGNLMKMTP